MNKKVSYIQVLLAIYLQNLHRLVIMTNMGPVDYQCGASRYQYGYVGTKMEPVDDQYWACMDQYEACKGSC